MRIKNTIRTTLIQKAVISMLMKYWVLKWGSLNGDLYRLIKNYSVLLRNKVSEKQKHL